VTINTLLSSMLTGMTDRPRTSNPQYNWAGFPKATGDERIADRQRYWQRLEYLTYGQRIMLGWGGTLLGLGTGIALAFAIYIFEKAHPLEVINSQGSSTSVYPNMALTVLLVLVGSLAAAFGLAALVAALISTRTHRSPSE
jgi:hypothetical protein